MGYNIGPRFQMTHYSAMSMNAGGTVYFRPGMKMKIAYVGGVVTSAIAGNSAAVSFWVNARAGQAYTSVTKWSSLSSSVSAGDYAVKSSASTNQYHFVCTQAGAKGSSNPLPADSSCTEGEIIHDNGAAWETRKRFLGTINSIVSGTSVGEAFVNKDGYGATVELGNEIQATANSSGTGGKVIGFVVADYLPETFANLHNVTDETA